MLGYIGPSNKRAQHRMPELPEVETTLRGIAPHVERQKVTAVRLYDRRLRWPVPSDLPDRLVGRMVDAVERRSKYLLFRLGQDTLIVHFGMTGSMRVYRRAPALRRHDHIDLEFGNGVVLRYHDPRRFGAMLWASGDAGNHPLLAALGPEPLAQAFDADHLFKATRTRSAAIKLALMDSRLVVGVGNIYANEALFRAGILPTRAAKRISRLRLGRLVDAVRHTLTDAIAKGGSTLRDYVDSEGRPGFFQNGYFVYGRAGEPCRACGRRIRSLRIGGRATYFCPRCQR
jgi:formamidopyrimidine-DNA glycosylase